MKELIPNSVDAAIEKHVPTYEVKDGKIYVTLFPCNECAKAIIQSGIKEVIYISDKYRDSDSVIASKRMFDLCGIKYRKYEGKTPRIDFVKE